MPEKRQQKKKITLKENSENRLFKFIRRLNLVWDRMSLPPEDREKLFDNFIPIEIYELTDEKLEEGTQKYLDILKETA